MKVRFPKFRFSVSFSHHFKTAVWLAQCGYSQSGNDWWSKYDYYVPVHTRGTLSGKKEITNWVRREIAESVIQDQPTEFVAIWSERGTMRAIVCDKMITDASVIVVQEANGNNQELARIMDGGVHSVPLTNKLVEEIAGMFDDSHLPTLEENKAMAEQAAQIKSIYDANKTNFHTLGEAYENGDVVLIDTTRKSDNAPVSLICAVSWNGSERILSPFAVMVEGDPYELFNEPNLG